MRAATPPLTALHRAGLACRIYEAAPAVLVPAIAIAMLTISITLLIDGFSGRSRVVER